VLLFNKSLKAKGARSNEIALYVVHLNSRQLNPPFSRPYPHL
jgi:hypothetical protein